jgi:hydrogenase maturation protease
MTDLAGRVLVIGWGNSLRGDDGLGWHAAALLAADPRLAGADVLARHQLTPELAEDVGRACLVVLVDAADGDEPAGSISVVGVEPSRAAMPAWTHHADPAALLALAGQLYGRVPPALQVRVGAASFEPGERLSPAVADALPRVVATVARLVADCCRRSGADLRSGNGPCPDEAR